MTKRQTPRIAILASGGGSTAEAFIHATQKAEEIDAEVGLVISNKSQAGVFDRVKRLNALYGLNIQTEHISGHTHPGGKQERGQTLQESEAICRLLEEGGFSHVALMGYMRKVNGALLEQYGWRPEYGDGPGMYNARMSNSHPGPLGANRKLPNTADTYGVYASEAVWQASRAQRALGHTAWTEHTVHLVAAEIDQGPVIARHDIKVAPDDTPEIIFDNVRAIEQQMLPVVIDAYLERQRLDEPPSHNYTL